MMSPEQEEAARKAKEAADRAEKAQKERLEMEKVKEVRRRLEQFASRIGPSDGSNKEALREWLDAIDHAFSYTGNHDSLVIEMVGYLTKGTLAKVVREKMLATNEKDRTWELCKSMITENFLSVDECEFLRSKVEKLHQGPNEDIREYANKYNSAVSKAYTETELKVPLIQERLIKTFNFFF